MRASPLPPPRHAAHPALLAAALLLCGCTTLPAPEAVLLHAAFGDARDVVLEGRVVEEGAEDDATVDDDSRTNLRRNAALFTADECERCPVELALADAPPVTTTTDDEGFFRVELSPDGEGLPGGWLPLVATSGSGAQVEAALIVPSINRFGIVSDIDDTVLVTEVADSFRMLGNTFLKNPLQREAVPGMAALYTRTLALNPRPEAPPLFYLSSSPRELHGYLTGFLARNGFPRGVVITRRLTLDAVGYGQLDTFDYKTARLVDILERLPDVTFVLVGDDGERDPEVYAGIRRRYPERIAAIWIRRVSPRERVALPEGQIELADVLAEIASAAPAQPPVPTASPSP